MRQVQFQGRHFAPSNVLRQNQVDMMREQIQQCEDNIRNAKYAPVDVKSNVARMRALEDQLIEFEAKPFKADELDDAIKEEREIRRQLSESMLSDKEMHRAPQRAAERHIRWEELNKPKVLYWKGLRMRLHKSGVDFGISADNVANLEHYRPLEKTNDPNFDTALIPGKEYHPVPEMPFTKPEANEDRIDIEVPAGIDANPIVLEKRFMSLKKQVKELTGTAPKNKVEALSLLENAGIVYK